MSLRIVLMVTWNCSHYLVGDELGTGDLVVVEGVVVGVIR